MMSSGGGLNPLLGAILFPPFFFFASGCVVIPCGGRFFSTSFLLPLFICWRRGVVSFLGLLWSWLLGSWLLGFWLFSFFFSFVVVMLCCHSLGFLGLGFLWWAFFSSSFHVLGQTFRLVPVVATCS